MTPERWARLKCLFESAVETADDERTHFLTAAAITDPDLAGELGKLLRNHKDAGSLFDGPAVTRNGMLEYLSGAARTFEIGETVSQRFRIERFLGAGGMGEVYGATDLELGGFVAVKTLRLAMSANPEMIARFKQEIQLSRRVTHPNVCRIFDLFQHRLHDGILVTFVTMELIEGETLTSKIRKSGRISQKQALHFARQMVEGLSAAHRSGIVHGDFKSGNVILASVPGKDIRLVVTDFGLAREYDESVTEWPEIAGTPAYIAPEQLEGKPPTPACDIYALGVVLFEMITGRLPFDGDTPSIIAAKQLRETAPLASVMTSDVTRLWDATIRHCLERDPARRPRSAADVLWALEDHHKGRRWFAGVMGAAAIGTFFRWRLTTPRVFAAEAVIRYKRGEEFARRRTREGLENAVVEYNQAVLKEPSYADAWAGLAAAWSALGQFRFADSKTAYMKAKEAARRAIDIDGRCGRAHGVLAYCMSLDVHEWMGAEKYFRQAVAISPDDSDIRLWYGAYLSKRGRSKDAIAQLGVGLAHDPTSLVLNLQLAAEYFLTSRADDLRRQAREVVRLQPFEATAHLMMARSLELDRHYEEALQSCDDAVKYGHPAAALCVRGSIEASRGNLAEARRIVARIAESWAANPYTESLLLAGLYCKIGDRQKALDVLFQGYERNDSTVLMAATHPHLASLASEPRYHEFLRKIGAEQ